MNSTEKHRRFKRAAIALGVFLGLALGEVAARFWIDSYFQMRQASEQEQPESPLRVFHSNAGRWQGHPYANFIPRPGYTYELGGKVVSRHNSLGFRGGEFPVAKPEGVFRIVMIGGSAVYTSRVIDDDRTIPAQLQQALKAKGYERVEVINGGVNGQSTAEMLGQLQFRILELSPDLVIVYEAINDLHNRYVPYHLFHPDNRGRLRRWEEMEWPFWANSALALVVARALGIFDGNFYIDHHISAPTYLGHTAPEANGKGVNFAKLLKNNPPIFFRENLLSIYAICKVRGIKVVFTSYGYSLAHADKGFLRTKAYLPGLQEMNETARSLAKEYSIPFFDYDRAMPKLEEFWRDEIHVSHKGALVTGRLFADYLIDSKLLPK